MTPAEAARHFARAAKAAPRNLKAAEAETLKDAKKQAIIFSSGGVSTKQLAQAGHPFSTRAPNAAYDPTIVNKQKGVFVASFRTIAPVVSSAGILSSLVNIDPISGYLATGTSAMIQHSPAQRILDAVEPAREKRIQQAIQDAFYKP